MYFLSIDTHGVFGGVSGGRPQQQHMYGTKITLLVYVLLSTMVPRIVKTKPNEIETF